MKKRLYNKLKSNSGVSILFALLLFMVVMLVSTTIITVAMTSMKRIDSNKDSRQRNLALESAAMMIRNDLNNLTYEIETNKPVLKNGNNNNNNGNGQGNAYAYGHTPKYEYITEETNLTGTLFSEEVKSIAGKLQSSDTSPIEGSFAINTNMDEIPQVDVTYTLSRSEGTYTTDGNCRVYKLVYTLQCGENRMYETFSVSFKSEQVEYTVQEENNSVTKDKKVYSTHSTTIWKFEGVSSR